MDRRRFLKGAVLFLPACGLLSTAAQQALAAAQAKNAAAGEADTGLGDYKPGDHWYGMGVEIDKCIGCNRCVEACKAENDVPRDMFHFRTWVERYKIRHDGEASVECISTQQGKEATPEADQDVVRTFFVPKLCNQCAHPPCTQVCPVGATFPTEDGVVLVDKERCIGCRYCIQACPYGARYLNPLTRTADKCTFCYHRLVKGLVPACVEVCPTQARVFGDLKSKASRLVRFERMNHISVLKPALNTVPKVYYAQLDGEVR
ncbi:MAG: 4Fe-4S dicluster domain-containing protein [Candidatus Eisenbacteria bacterium]|nr:4Fe-4S dicluster domain-containing protein [Candidatus Eisenbacteria bacterium]